MKDYETKPFVHHYILLASDWVRGRRVCMNFTSKDGFNRAYERLLLEVKASAPFSLYGVTTYSEKFESVMKKDPFYADVYLIEDLEEFIKIIKESSVISASSIAPLLILGSTVHRSNLKLQKLLYFCYAEYLVKYNERLFDDKIEAWAYGPVVGKVYAEYKGFKKGNISVDNHTAQMVYSARVLQTSEGPKAMKIISGVLQKLGGKTAAQLVALTHVKGGPWARTYDDKTRHKVISDEVIKKYYKPLGL